MKLIKTQNDVKGTWKLCGKNIETDYLMKNIKAYTDEAENCAKIWMEIYFYNYLADGEDAIKVLEDYLPDEEDRTITAENKGFCYEEDTWLKKFDVVAVSKNIF